MLNNRETYKKKICTIQSQVTSTHRKPFKKILPLTYSRAYLRKGRYASAIPSLMLRRFISFSLLVKPETDNPLWVSGETKPKNFQSFLWCCSCRIESNVSLNPWISVLNFVSTECQFFYFVFFLWERFQWFCRLITDRIKNILFSRFVEHNNFVYTRLHLAFYLGL